MPIGKQYVSFGRYLLVERLAGGGMGEVFLARERGDNAHTVVVKRLHTGVSSNPDAQARFLDESRIATLMDHPNIVRVLEVGIHDNAYFMAMEWLLGWELREIIDRARDRRLLLTVPVIVKLAIDACRGLAAAHTLVGADGQPLGIVHRDVSPRNLFVTADGTLKLLDFGLAKSSLQQRRTQARVVMGTFGYMAPEQIEGEPVDQRTDLFSLGAVLHELLTGKPLFQRGGVDLMLQAMLTERITPPIRDSERVDTALVAIVMRLLQRKADMRYPNASAVERDLETLPGGAASEQHVAETMTRLFDGDAGHAARATTEKVVAAPRPSSAHVALSHWAEDVDRQTVDIHEASPKRWRPMAWLAAGLIAIAAAGFFGVRYWPHQRAVVAEQPTSITTPAAVPAPRLAAEPAPHPAAEPAPRRAAEPAPAADVTPPVEVAPPPPPPRPATSPSPLSQTKHPPRAPPRPSKGHAAKAEAPGVEAPAPPRAKGRLTLDARPWANVYLGDRLLGPTPLIERELPAGPTVLRLVDPANGSEQTVTVDIPANGELRRVVQRRGTGG